MNTLSVVLLNFNGKHHLESFLPSVVKYSNPYDVIVVDNGSNDDSVEFVKKNHPSVKIISFEKNFGFCGGYNRALSQIQSEYVVLLNTDVEVTKNWIDPILKQFLKDKSIRAAQPKILDQKDKTKFEYAGGAGGYIDKLGYPFCRGRIFQTIEVDKEQYQDSRDIFWASGSCLFIHRQTYIDLGGLDEDFFAHMEEIDLCWRIWNAGHRVIVVPESKVFHVGGGTLDKSKPRKTYLNFRNGLSLLIKNEKTSSLIWKLPLRVALDWVALIKFSIESGANHGLAILKAHIHVFLRLRSIFKKRSKINNNYKKPIMEGWVIWLYFIKGKKKFSQMKSIH